MTLTQLVVFTKINCSFVYFCFVFYILGLYVMIYRALFFSVTVYPYNRKLLRYPYTYI